ncbi:PKD domain-containing protein [Nocardioides panacisoli]|uniref:PKD domain-containing protein n=1 Tax=Nocardioides panacisoli TaxID=627624 RepID=UPI001C630E2E|nr:PKD domain-containing protein [Nocardioides panacisoli]QYJ04216.1 PKD domain-containing protein [Nocardioides panacisoli]
MSKTVVSLLSLLLAVAVLAASPPASAEDSPGGQLVSDSAVNGTPHVLDGRVYSVTQVGDTMFLGGTFSTARNNNSQSTLSRANLLAFDADSGQISNSFVPNPNGVVHKVLSAGDGATVYVAGNFSSIGGVARKNLARVRISDGSVVSSFDAGNITGQIRDTALVDGRLWIGGAFTHVGGTAQRALATVDPGSGDHVPYMGLVLDGNHNDGNTQVLKFDHSPDRDRLVAVGNFDTLDGVVNHQLLALDTSGPSAAPASFRTNFYTATCSRSFDTYMRDVDFSPDGRFFVVTTTGAYGGSNGPCDTSARFETDAVGTDVQPSWVDYTGGDTTYGVEVTDTAVYVGGHFRWQNNPFRGDNPGQGAVGREGIAALDPVNGLPYSWNPGRTKGVGVFDFLRTAAGLWVASDTDRIGNFQLRSRIALLGSDGPDVPAVSTPGLPNDLYAVGRTGSVPDPSILYRVNAGGPEIAAPIGPVWQADTAGTPSPHLNGGQQIASWGPVPTVDGTVPSSTPSEVFSTERWDPSSAPEQQWDFSVPSGTPLEVRLYFANRCDCTDQVGERRFHVDIDGTRVLNDLDLVASVGDDVGTMRSFAVTSDGNVDIDLFHLVENPLINAIEIVRTDVPPVEPEDGAIERRPMTETTVGEAQAVPGGGIDWNQVRGAFMLNGWLYTATSDGIFTRRTFDGNAYGAPQPVDGADQIVALTDWRSDIGSLTGLYYDSGRIYYTLAGSDFLHYRYFTSESGVVGAKRLVAASSTGEIDYSEVRGLFGTASQLFWATSSGDLRRIDWQHQGASGAPVAGTATTVSGPGADGVEWGARDYFLAQDEDGQNSAPNQAPVASFSVSCLGLTCSFDGSGSSDADGSVASYAWDFGDGESGSGASVSHTYADAGPRTVELTVTDDDGAVGSATEQADPEEGPVAAVSFVGSDSSNTNAADHTVFVPGGVQAGDRLLLSMAVNTEGVSVADPAGWTPLESVAGSNVQGRLWTRAATASDAGSLVVVSLDGFAKADLTVTAHRGSGGAASVSDSGAEILTADGTAHAVPDVSTGPGDWVVSSWAAKASHAVAWSAPGSYEVRAGTDGAGGGRITSMTADTGPVAGGAQSGGVATSDPSVRRVVALTAVVSPAGGGGGGTPNQAPVASFSVSCLGLTCSFDGSGSSDADGSVASYAWDFGDGESGSGASVSHTYADAGPRTVELTVTDDDGAVGSATEQADPEEGPVAAVSFVGSDSSNTNAADHTVFVPGGVQAGDRLLLSMAVNTEGVSVADPAGWTPLESVAGSNVQGRLWTRAATASDAGSLVVVSLDGYAKADLTVTAHRGSGGAASVSDSGADILTADGTAHAVPDVSTGPGDWVVSSWAAKASHAVAWSAPGSYEVRGGSDGAGGGRITSMTADTGPVAGGAQSGGVATSDPSVRRVVALTAVIGAG